MSGARASSVGGTVPVTNTAAHRNFRAQAAAKRERLLAPVGLNGAALVGCIYFADCEVAYTPSRFPL
jgi:hypothetical protein